MMPITKQYGERIALAAATVVIVYQNREIIQDIFRYIHKRIEICTFAKVSASIFYPVKQAMRERMADGSG